ncbi:MAG: YeiH family putative sulfate export transporter [Desulfobacteraceae bacterium]|nr:MAG: YeiH family putative sulfate export transporter [Desulfobacteraceae bacterium]
MNMDSNRSDTEIPNTIPNIGQPYRRTGLMTLADQFSFLLPPETAALIPGLLLTISIAAIAIYTGAQLTYVTPLIVAMGIGILLRNAFILLPAYKDGINYSIRQVLRFAVALLGVRITIENITGLGWEGLIAALVPLVITLFVTMWMGRRLGCDPSQTFLIATGTSICGASAIMTAGAVTQAKEDNVVVAISSITVFGTILMLAYPMIFKSGVLGLAENQYGIWAGASIHEVAQVIAAAFGGGEVSGEIGTIVKLTRVSALVPFAFIVSFLYANNFITSGGNYQPGQVKFPFFLLGFLGMVMLNSYDFFTPKAVKAIEYFDMFLLTMAMGAMGLETDFKQLLKIGYKPLVLSIFSTLTISLISLIIIYILY